MIKKFWPLAVIVIIWSAFSFPYFFQQKVPYPAAHQVNAFSPWSRYSTYASPVKNNAMPDVIDQIYPWKYFSIEQLKKGSIPFWNPYSFSGTPHMANYQTAIFSPFTLLYFILPFIDAWSVVVLLQPLLAGVFTYLYVRKRNVSRQGSLVAGIAFMFSGFMVVWMAYGTLGMAIAILPFLLYLIDTCFDNKSFLLLVGISLSLAFSFLSGHFQTSIYVTGVSILYLIFTVYIKRDYITGIWVGLYMGFGMLLTMPQLLPSLEFFQNAPRSVTQVGSSGIPFYNLITIIAPDFFGNPVTRNNLFLDFAEWQAFLGATAFLLSLFAISFSKKKAIQLFFVVIGLIALLFAVASPLQNVVSNLHIPVLSSSTQSRVIIIFSFCFAVLAGFGFDSLQIDIQEKRYKALFIRIGILLGCIVGIWGVLYIGKFLSDETLQIAKKNFLLPSTLLVFVSAGIIVTTYIKKKYVYLFLQMLLIGLVSFESFRYATKWMPFDEKKLVFPNEKITEVLQTQLKNGRVYGNLGQQMSVYYGLGSIEGYDPLYIQRYGEFITGATTGIFTGSGGRTVDLDKKSKNADKVLNLLAVNLIFHPVADTNAVWAYPVWQKKQMKRVYNDPIYSVYNNTDALPHAKMFYGYQTMNKKEAIIAQFYKESFDYKNTLILEEKSPVRPTKNTKNTVSINDYEPNTGIMHIWTEYSGMLFISDPYYPGWKAYIDGKETKIYRADYAFRAIAIPPGSHIVTFTYVANSFSNGVILAGIGLILLSSFLLVPKRFKRQPKVVTMKR
jgi:hypothetical protein